MAVDVHGLSSTTEEILKNCPRFRILLVGKSGVGKSSLINHAFSVDIATVSHQTHGICNIETEIISSQNPRFVLHDSQGFEPGDISNLSKVKNFIQMRGDSVDLRDRIHAVWLCVQVPFAGGRVFETGDEEFLKLGLKVPIIVVFTKFDKLVDRQEEELTDEELEATEDEITKLSNERADKAFNELCVDHIKRLGPGLSYVKVSVDSRYRRTLPNLIDVTQGLVSKYVEGDVWIVSAMAQRASAQAKIDSSIEVGMKRYWQGLASSAHFSGVALETCLATIHNEITSDWNFNDPKGLLESEDFRKQIMALAQLVAPEASDLSSWFPQSLETIKGIVGIASLVASSLAPPVAAIGLSAIFVKRITEIYQRTPETLRCLMGYIVDLTLVMDQLFLDTLPQKPPRQLTRDQIEMALETYKNTEAQKVHRQIRDYANKASFAQTLYANNAQRKVEELIRQYRTGGSTPSSTQ